MDSDKYIVAGITQFHVSEVEGKSFDELSAIYTRLRPAVIKELVSKLKKRKPKKVQPTKVEKVVKPKEDKPTED
jgi:hypothetical protein